MTIVKRSSSSTLNPRSHHKISQSRPRLILRRQTREKLHQTWQWKNFRKIMARMAPMIAAAMSCEKE